MSFENKKGLGVMSVTGNDANIFDHFQLSPNCSTKIRVQISKFDPKPAKFLEKKAEKIFFFGVTHCVSKKRHDVKEWAERKLFA